MIIKTKPIEYKRESAIKRARQAISQRINELKFLTLPKATREKIKELGLDPASRNEQRKEYR